MPDNKIERLESRVMELRKALNEVKEFLDCIEPRVGEYAFNEIYGIVEEALEIK